MESNPLVLLNVFAYFNNGRVGSPSISGSVNPMNFGDFCQPDKISFEIEGVETTNTLGDIRK